MGKILFNNIKFEVREDVVTDFKSFAIALGLFDGAFSEEEQGGGYHRFKELCFYSGELPIKYDQNNVQGHGWYLMQGLHVGIRQQALNLAHNFRKRHKIQVYE